MTSLAFSSLPRAEACAALLGLAFECRRTGYGRLAPSLSSFVAVA
jgi:hypothetical protein